MITVEALLEQSTKLLGYARGLTRSTEDAKDLWQETQLRAWRNKASWKGENLAGWLSIIMRNIHVTARARRHSIDTVSVIGSIPELSVENAGSALVDAERAFASLTPLERELINAMLAGSNYPFLAEKYGLTEDGIRQRLVRARAKLQEYL